jgi:His/Glu/Gln/Arg/opine family amino acid ABC transporter permease subunit
MSNWDRFVETFFNAKVMAKYLPDIAHGMLVTLELAALVIVSGIAAGLALALLRSLGLRPVNLLIVFVVDLFRALPPLVIIVFIYFGLPAAGVSPSGFVSTWLSLALVLMAFSEEILLGRHHLDRARAVGGGALDRTFLRPDADERGAAAGDPPHDSAADQPNDRDHEGNRARHRRRGERDPGHGLLGGVQQLQPIAADAWRGRVPDPVLPDGGVRPLARDAHALETLNRAADLLQPRDHRRGLENHPRRLGNTVLLSIVVVPLGLAGGLILSLLAGVRHPWVRWPLMAWVDFFRAFPPLVLLIFLFAGLPFAGLELAASPACASHFSSIPAPITARSCGGHRVDSGGPDRCGAQHRPRTPADDALRGPAPGRAQRVARSAFEHARGRQAHFAGSVVAMPELLFQARQAQSLTTTRHRSCSRL